MKIGVCPYYILYLEKPAMGIFSQEEIDSMQEVLNTFKQLTSEEITRCSHREEAWTKPKDKEIINYEYARNLTSI